MNDKEREVMREYYDRRGKAYYHRYYSQLEGAKIVSFKGMVDEEYTDSEFPTFVVKTAKGELLEISISKDPEGNGGGFIFGLYSPNMSDFDAEKQKLGITL